MDSESFQEPFERQLLAEFRPELGEVTIFDCQTIVEQARLLFEQNYVHLPLKRRVYAVDPIRKLDRVHHELSRMQEQGVAAIPALRFHNTMISVFKSVNDRHMNYLLPEHTIRNRVAFVPFLIEESSEEIMLDGGETKRVFRYIVTKVTDGYFPQELKDQNCVDQKGCLFRKGVQILQWNNIDIATAVELQGENFGGNNPTARRVRGLATLTVRPLAVTSPPVEDKVKITFLPEGSSEPISFEEDWHVIGRPDLQALLDRDDPGLTGPPEERAPSHLAVDIEQDICNQAKFALFAPSTETKPPPLNQRVEFQDGKIVDLFQKLIEDRKIPFARKGANAQPTVDASDVAKLIQALPQFSAQSLKIANDDTTDAAPEPPANPWKLPKSVMYGDDIEFQAADGTTYQFGYIRIKSFNVDPEFVKVLNQLQGEMATDEEGSDPPPKINVVQLLIEGFREILESVGQDGLIIDVRANGGGQAQVAETILQFLTPRKVHPHRLQFLNSPANFKICNENTFFRNLWGESMRESATTAAVFSGAFPVTPDFFLDFYGQRYYGPVVVLTDALSFSATDVFVAGFKDNQVGKVIGTNDRTGAGGATLWTHGKSSDNLMKLYDPEGCDFGSYKELPLDVNMTVSIQRFIRAGINEGTLLEDFGVKPDIEHFMTRRDILEGNKDLKQLACETLFQAIKERGGVFPLVISPPLKEDRLGKPKTGFWVTSKGFARVDVLYRADVLPKRPFRFIQTQDVAGKDKLFIETDLIGEFILRAFDDKSQLVAFKKFSNT